MTNGFNFLIYKTPDKDVKVNAVIKDDTIWLTQNLWQNCLDVHLITFLCT